MFANGFQGNIIHLNKYKTYEDIDSHLIVSYNEMLFLFMVRDQCLLFTLTLASLLKHSILLEKLIKYILGM